VMIMYYSMNNYGQTQSKMQQLLLVINDKLIYRSLVMAYQSALMDTVMSCSLQMRFMSFENVFSSFSTILAFVVLLMTILLMIHNLQILSRREEIKKLSPESRICGFQLSLISDDNCSKEEKRIMVFENIQKSCYSIIMIALNHTVAQVSLLIMVNLIFIPQVIKRRGRLKNWQLNILNTMFMSTIFGVVLVFAINDSFGIMKESQKVNLGLVMCILLACYVVFLIVRLVISNKYKLKKLMAKCSRKA